ncbi:MAG: ATP-binding protein, partial [Polyangiaceae bacterium]|nr:ATP-binding protein [Polyangiaceae bacterium]
GGLRLRLLMLLGGLLLFAFLPLYFATFTYTRLALSRVQQKADEAHLQELSAQTLEKASNDPAAVAEICAQQVNSGRIAAWLVLAADGSVLSQQGRPELVAPITAWSQKEAKKQKGIAQEYQSKIFEWRDRLYLAISQKSTNAQITLISLFAPDLKAASQLTQLMALYMLLLAATVLSFSNFALTRWIVRPILELRDSAARVSGGGTMNTYPRHAAAEVQELGRSLIKMTSNLQAEKAALAEQVRQVEKKTAELEAAQASLVKSERLASVGRLSAGLAHEIGNPLSALMGLTDLLLSEELQPSEEKDFLMRIKAETERIDLILKDLLAFARSSHDQEQEGHSPQPVDGQGNLQLALQGVLTLLKPQKLFEAVKIDVQLGDSLPPLLLDDAQLTQIFLNLLMNSAQALSKAPITSPKIQIHGSVNSEGLLIVTVKDNGPGIAEDIKATLFEPFVSTKEVGTGSGLGLAVTRALLESHDSQIELLAPDDHSENRGGAVFRLELMPSPSYSLLSSN